MGVKISDVAAKGSADGTELFAVSDSLVAKSVTGANIKDYVIDQIKAVTDPAVVDGNDKIYILDNTDTGLHVVDIDLVAQHAIDTVWGKAKEASPVDADEMALKDDGGVEKTVLLSVLAEYVRGAIEGDILDISDLADGSGAIATTDYMLVTQGSTGKYITLQDVIDEVYSGLVAHVTGLDASAGGADADILYSIKGGVAKELTLLQIKNYLGNSVTGPGSTTEDNIPQWTATNDDLKDGLTLTTGNFDAGVDTSLASTKAIRDQMDEIIDDEDDIGDALADGDHILVYDVSDTNQHKSAFSRIWTWILTKLLTITDVNSIATMDTGWVIDEDTLVSDSDTKVPTQQSVKAYVDSGGGWDGDITDIDLDGGSDIDEALDDGDLILVDNGADGTNRKSEISRIKTYLETTNRYGLIWVPAKDMTPSTTAGCDTETHEYATNDMNHYVMLFAGAAADESAEFDLVMPGSWDLGTLQFKIYWTNGHADANPAEYVEFYMKAGARGDDDALDAAVGSEATVTDQLISDDDLHITDSSTALTASGTPALNDMIHFKLSRDYDYDGGGTAMDVDARVFGVLIQYQMDQADAGWA